MPYLFEIGMAFFIYPVEILVILGVIALIFLKNTLIPVFLMRTKIFLVSNNNNI
jgi:hypothetical protein